MSALSLYCSVGAYRRDLFIFFSEPKPIDIGYVLNLAVSTFRQRRKCVSTIGNSHSDTHTHMNISTQTQSHSIHNRLCRVWVRHILFHLLFGSLVAVVCGRMQVCVSVSALCLYSLHYHYNVAKHTGTNTNSVGVWCLYTTMNGFLRIS